jgi:hypothetical protein
MLGTARGLRPACALLHRAATAATSGIIDRALDFGGGMTGSNMWRGLSICAVLLSSMAAAQSPDADIDAVQRKLDAAKQAQAAKDAAARRSQEQLARMATLLFRTDADCSLSINGKAQGVLSVGDTKEVKVNPGDQLVDCVSTDAATVSINELKTATAGTQSAVLLQLADRVNQELQQAAAAAQAKADAEAKAAREKALRDFYTIQGDGSVRDNQTGTTWTGSDNGSDIDWKAAGQYCSNLGAGWTLPTVAELQGLVDTSGTLSQACGGYTCRVKPSIRLSDVWFWSSEPNGSSEAWTVELDKGDRDSDAVSVANASRALCVRRS